MKKLLFCLLFAFILLAPTVLGATYDITYDIDGEAHVRQTLESNTTDPKIWVEEDAYNFEVRSDNESTSFSLERREGFKLLRPDVGQANKEIKIEYRTSQVIERGENSYFITTFRPGQDTDFVSIELILPERALLKDEGTGPISPEPDSVETDGRRISVNWSLEDLEEDEQIPLFVAYEEPRNVLTLVLYLILIGLLAFGFVYKKRVQNKEDFEKRFKHLVERERKVVDALMEEKDNIMWQKELQNATGFTKSKLSRTLKKMEERGIVEKIPYGTSNKVKLVEDED